MTKTDLSYCAFGARTLLKHLGRLTGEMEGVRDHAFEDPEYVHRMRVATRRLRSALPLFAPCFPQNQVQIWEKEIKSITGILGEARDMDVQLISLKEILDTISDSRPAPGIQRLSLRIRQKRNSLQERVVIGLDRFTKSGVERTMMGSIRVILGKAKVKESPTLSETIFSTALDRISERMADTLSYDDLVRDPANVEQLHALRKSAKRLRYTLEFYDSPYDHELKPYIEKVKDLQTLLGNIHDCDVWTCLLPIFIEEETARTLNYYGHTHPMARIKNGIEYLIKEQKEKRKVLYSDFIGSWDRLLTENFWEKLKTSLRSGSNLLDHNSRKGGKKKNEDRIDR